MTTSKNILSAVFLILAGLNQACSGKSFSTANADEKTGNIGGSGMPTCQDQLRTQSVPVKVLFVVDTSGSNLGSVNSAGTDPDKGLRGDSIQNFFDRYQAQSNFSWGFVVFQGTAAYSLVGNNSASASFSNNSGEMQQAINRFYNSADGGNTPYRAALAMARQAIQDDFTQSSDTKYIVVFISDGVPDPAVPNATLQADIQGLLSARPGQVVLSTIYYGYFDQTASNRLAMMASYGGGGFLDANLNNGQTFQIDSVIQIPGTNCSN